MGTDWRKSNLSKFISDNKHNFDNTKNLTALIFWTNSKVIKLALISNSVKLLELSHNSLIKDF